MPVNQNELIPESSISAHHAQPQSKIYKEFFCPKKSIFKHCVFLSARFFLGRGREVSSALISCSDDAISWNILFQIKSHAMGGENDDNDDHDRDDEESDDGDDVMVLKVKCIHSHGSSSSAGFTFSEVHLTYNTARKHHRIRASNLHSISSYPTPRKRDSYSSPRLLFTCNTSKYIKIHYITS